LSGMDLGIDPFIVIIPINYDVYRNNKLW